MTISSILFDLDGTLVDSRPSILAGLDAAVIALGHRPDPSFDLSFALGPPADQTIPRVLAHYEESRVAAGLAAFRAYQLGLGLLKAEPYPGIVEMLATFAELGIALSVVTFKREDVARALLDHLGLAGRFIGIHGARDGQVSDGRALDGVGSSDKAGMIRAIVTARSLDPTRTAMIGDRSFDMAGARANGLHAIGAGWGYGTDKELTVAGAEAIARDPGMVPALIAQL